MIRIFRIAAILAVAVPACLAAQEGKDSCPDARTQHDLNVCAAQDLVRADSVLNARYQALVGSMPSVQLELLRTAQRAWIRFRDAECAYQASAFEGGSMQPMVRSSCLARLTDARAAELGTMLTQGA